jgi:hypothetical protein
MDKPTIENPQYRRDKHGVVYRFHRFEIGYWVGKQKYWLGVVNERAATEWEEYVNKMEVITKEEYDNYGSNETTI